MGSVAPEQLTLCITTNILLEYEEVLARKRNAELATLIIEVILLMPNTVRVEKYFNFGLPTADPDDQKFTDCAVACGAAFLVTEDRAFQEVKHSPFPLVQIVSAGEFRAVFAP